MTEAAEQIILKGVFTEELEEWWPRAEPLIMRALVTRGTISKFQPKHLREYCEHRRMVLWVVLYQDEVQAAFLTKIDQYPLCKELVIWLACGREMEMWIPHIWDLFKRYAKAHACKTILIADRAGWYRVLSRYDKMIKKTITVYEV